jgi:hypothetical protein
MIMIGLISLSVGMAMAQRFKVMVLLPVIVLTLLFAIGLAIARDEPFWLVGAATAVAIIAVQIGYLLGAAAHHLMLLARASRLHSGALPSTLPPRHAAQ